MKKNLFRAITLVIAVSVVMFSAQSIALAKASPGRKIVVFNHFINSDAKDRIIANAGGTNIKDLDRINAKVVWVPDEESSAKLTSLPGVLRVDDDVLVQTQVQDEAIKFNRVSPQPAEILPWGVDRVNAPQVWPTGDTADPIKVGIIDTGISSTHPDLLANIKGGVNTIRPSKGWNDDNGHGSHVAGIVAGIDNTIGIVGVAPAADLYAIKVLNSNGSGYISDIIEGIEWAITNNMQVINMSLGTSANIQSFHDAVIAAHNAGIVEVAAAGNSGGSVIYPAAYPETIAISATDQTDTLASWSSRGPEVDLSAPGVSIYSTYRGTGYSTLSGTSMATPHVTGSVALVLNTPVGLNDINANGKWDPNEVLTKLESTAADLGTAGFDNSYGYGLVNAFAATE